MFNTWEKRLAVIGSIALAADMAYIWFVILGMGV